MTLLLRLFFCLSLLAALPLTAAAQLEELGEAGESDFNPLNPRPNYRGPALGWEKNLPPDSSRRRYSVFLIGDVGSPIPAERGGEPSLNFMRRQMLQAGRNSATIFLGDNIYNQGMPPVGAYDRQTAESRLNEQLDILKGYQGEKYITPGNHDWIQGYTRAGWRRSSASRCTRSITWRRTRRPLPTPATSWCPATAAPAPTKSGCATIWC